jgi:hypothetical protein
MKPVSKYKQLLYKKIASRKWFHIDETALLTKAVFREMFII